MKNVTKKTTEGLKYIDYFKQPPKLLCTRSQRKDNQGIIEENRE